MVIGVDLGGTFVKTAAVSEAREVVAKDLRPTNAAEGPEAVFQAMQAGVAAVMEAAGIQRDEVIAAGFGAPGPMNWQTGVVYSPPNLPGWQDVPLAAIMTERLGFPCFVENDANCACYGEFWMGAGRGTESMAVLTLGTGLGGGVVVFGRLLRGIDGTAAELGHLKVQRDGRPCGCGGTGCLEQYASVTGMVLTAREGLESGQQSLLNGKCNHNYDLITGKMIADTAEQGDLFAKWVFEETATWLALGIASIIHYQNPERVILCGGMIAAGELLFSPLRVAVLKNTFAVPGKRCQILPAGLGADSGVLGAAGCAWERARA
jgi:glucokinase